MATKHPRVQVTVDPELAEAMAAVDAHPKSRSQLLRNLALRGAETAVEERMRREKAREFFHRVGTGEIEMDFTGAQEVWKEREAEAE